MHRSSALRSVALVAGVVGCGGPRGHGPLAPLALMTDARVLGAPALEGRRAGSPGEVTAAAYVEAQLAATGLVVRRQRVPGAGENLFAMLPGSRGNADVIVVGAHLDHLGVRGGRVYPGADDNASGVAVLLGLARELTARKAELERGVLFVVFTAEEEQLRGSKAFVSDPLIELAHVRAMVNLDMVGRPLLDHGWARAPLYLLGIDRDATLGLVGARRYPALRALVDREVTPDRVLAAEDLPQRIGREVERQSEGRSDSASFEAVGIPSLFFGDGESRDYHSPRDTLDQLRPELMSRRATAIARVLVALSRAPDDTFAPARTPVGHPIRAPRAGLYLPFGPLLGITGRGAPPATPSSATTLEAGAAFTYGAAVSLVYFRPFVAAAISAEVLRSAGTTRIAIGPSLAIGPLGIGVDTLLTPFRSHTEIAGVAGRIFASAGIVTLSLRAGSWASAAFADFTLQISFPLRIH